MPRATAVRLRFAALKVSCNLQAIGGFALAFAYDELARGLIKAGLSEIPCWVTEMDDDTAYMELVKANNQGELLALEIGIHANETVMDKTKKDGGLKKYASEIGRGKDSVEQWSKAGFVYLSLTETYRLKELHNKTSHLYEISKSPAEHWQMLVDLLIKCDWSVKDVQGMELWAA